MVRNIVAALVHVSRTRTSGAADRKLHSAHDISTMLGWKKRSMMRLKPAPAEGLYLRSVHYKEDDSEDWERYLGNHFMFYGVIHTLHNINNV